MVAFSLTPAFAGIVASITNSVNTLSTGTLVMEEKNNDGSKTCTTDNTGTVTCADINKYDGQSLAPGGVTTTSIKIINKGSVPAKNFTVNGGDCASTNVPGATLSDQGMKLYLDGELSGSNPTATMAESCAAGYGYWKVGCGKLGGWRNAGSQTNDYNGPAHFTGQLQFVSVYESALTPEQARDHFLSGAY